MTIDRELTAYVLAGLFAASTLWLLLRGWLRGALAKGRARRRNRRARRGEQRAEGLVEKYGYTVEDRQVPATWTIEVDGQEREIELRADLVVSRRGRHYVAEVKTGRLAPRISTAATRRQLLEYRLAYDATHDVDGVLLVDVEAGRVIPVEFPLPRVRAPIPILLWIAIFATGAGAGLCAAFALG